MRTLALRDVGIVAIGSAMQRGYAALLPLVIIAAATRRGGFDDAGVVGIATAAALLCVHIADLGVTPLILRDFPVARPSHRAVLGTLRISLSAGAALGGALLSCAIAVGDVDLGPALAVAALAVPAWTAGFAATGAASARRDGRRLVIAANASFVAGCTALVAMSAVSSEPWALLVALPVARWAEATMLAWRPGWAEGADTAFGLSWIRGNWPVFVTGLLQGVYLRGQVLLPGVVLSATERGQVADGFALGSAASLLSGAFALSTAPLVSRDAARGISYGMAAAKRYGAIGTALVSIPAVVLLTIPSVPLDIIYGESPGGLESYVRWAGLSVLILPASAQALTLLLAMRRQVTVLMNVAGLAATGVTLSLALPAVSGVAGAGQAIVVAEAVQVLLFLAAVTAARAPEHRMAWRIHAGALAAAGALGAAAPILGGWLIFPRADTGILLVCLLPLAVGVVIHRCHYDWLAPASIFAVIWSICLAVAQFPLYPAFNWSGEMWFLMTVPPAAFVVGAVVTSGRTAVRVDRSQSAAFGPPTTVAIAAVLVTVGTLAWLNYFRSIGSVPLLTDRVDVLRFTEFDLPTLVGTRFSFAGVIVAVAGAGLASNAGERWSFTAIAVAGVGGFLFAGGRLDAIASTAAGLVVFFYVRGLSPQRVAVSAALAVIAVAGASYLWFYRIEQQPPNPFKDYFDGEVRPARPAAAEWLFPAQMAAAASMHALSDLVNTRAHESDEPHAGYSLKFADRVVPAGDLEAVARRSARYEQVTSTYVGTWWADYGPGVAALLSAAMGAAYGLLYRALRGASRSWALLAYGYAAFWLAFAPYLNWYTTHGLWVVDLPGLIALSILGHRELRRPISAAMRHLVSAGTSA